MPKAYGAFLLLPTAYPVSEVASEANSEPLVTEPVSDLVLPTLPGRRGENGDDEKKQS
jgi:hypothetical protein